MSFEPIAVRVRRGASLLDEVRPGWWREIATDRLMMDSCYRCVLGQLYGSFSQGSGFVTPWGGLPRQLSDMAHGFNLPPDEQRTSAGELWEELTACWRAEIAVRAAEGGGG